MIKTGKYILSFEFTENKVFKSELPEKIYIQTPVGNKLNPALSQNSIIQIHDMALLLDEILRISNNKYQLTSTQVMDTDYGRVVIKIKQVNSLFSPLYFYITNIITAVAVFLLAFWIFK